MALKWSWCELFDCVPEFVVSTVEVDRIADVEGKGGSANVLIGNELATTQRGLGHHAALGFGPAWQKDEVLGPVHEVGNLVVGNTAMPSAEIKFLTGCNLANKMNVSIRKAFSHGG